MERSRPDLGFGGELEQFDPSEWEPANEGREGRGAPEPEVAQASGFTSREAKPVVETETPAPAPRREMRGRRTGRNAQLNLKLRPETIERFYSVADGKGWMLGEAFEKALELLEKEVGVAAR